MAPLNSQEAVNQTDFFSKNTSNNRHREGYFRTYYLDNREKLLTYSQECYQVKKLVEPYLKEDKKNTDRHRADYWKTYQRKHPKIDRHREGYWQDYYQKKANKKSNLGVKCVGVVKTPSHTRIKKHSLREKELFFVRESGSSKEKLVRRLDQKYLRLPTKNKIPQKKGWNMPWFEEWLDKSGLLKKYQEWSLRGGQKLGDKYLSFLDIDIEKEEVEEWRKAQLRKNVGLLLKKLDCFHVETKKGFHVYLLSEELLPNEMLYHVDSWLGREKIIGSIQSKGKYVVGFDSVDKKLVEKGKWFWHVKNLEQVKSTLARFFLVVGREKKVDQKTDDYLLKLQQEISLKKPNVDNTFNTKKPCSEQLPQLAKKSTAQAKKTLSQAKILSKQKTCLADIWKVFYLDQKRQQAGYFLVNNYQKTYALPNLAIGSVRNMVLVSGTKHEFLSRIIM